MTDRNMRQGIQIERNPVEAFLMRAKDFIKKNKRQVVLSLGAFLLIAVVSISSFVYFEGSTTRTVAKYELIIEKYRQNPLDENVKKQTIMDLNGIIESTRFGFVPKAANYVLGNIYFEDDNFSEAYRHLNNYVNKTSVKDVLHPIALNKAAVSLEELDRIHDAIALLSNYESRVVDSIVMDQILFNLGRLHYISGDRLRAREYYNRLMRVYPDSAYAERARERLFLMSLKHG